MPDVDLLNLKGMRERLSLSDDRPSKADAEEQRPEDEFEAEYATAATYSDEDAVGTEQKVPIPFLVMEAETKDSCRQRKREDKDTRVSCVCVKAAVDQKQSHLQCCLLPSPK
ncbi:hypothetical protein MRX96_017949 [Rhipicephalus microplus]